MSENHTQCKRIRLVHIITGLYVGGAETVLWRLATRLAHSGYDNYVISLLEAGPIGDRLREAGIPVYSLGMRYGTPDVLLFIKLIRLLQTLRPDIIQTWMYHANLAGGLAAAMTGRVPCIWGIHNNLLTRQAPLLTRLVSWICARTSAFLPAAIVYCSDSSRMVHERAGYAAGKSHTIWNGFDLEAFQPDKQAGCEKRQALGLPADVGVVGMIARNHPQKDVDNFLHAAGILSQRMPDVRFILCGVGLDTKNLPLVELRDILGLRETCLMLGNREDVGALINAFDVATLSSRYGEALPLVIGEAMACGVPFVATDVGDAAKIIGDTGLVVPPHSPEALADAWSRILSLPEPERRALGRRGRERIVQGYSIDHMVESYNELYRDTLTKRSACTA